MHSMVFIFMQKEYLSWLGRMLATLSPTPPHLMFGVISVFLYLLKLPLMRKVSVWFVIKIVVN